MKSRVLRDRLRTSVILTMKDSAAFRGVLWAADDHAMVLRNVEHLGEGKLGPVLVDGELVVLNADVQFIQCLGRAVP
jgi:small nuclear ribonucleoprotein (snRNP)-like protein